MSGYCLYNGSEATLSFDLTDQTKYRFVDMGQLYTTLEDSESLAYETTSPEEFLNGSCYSASVSADDQTAISTHLIPYSVEIQSDRVISIAEEFHYAIRTRLTYLNVIGKARIFQRLNSCPVLLFFL